MTLTSPPPTTTRRPPAPAARDTSSVAPTRVVPTGHRARSRDLTRLLIAVGLVAGCGLVAAAAVTRSGNRSSVLVVVRPVAAGHVIGASDLAEEKVGAEGRARLVGAGARAAVIGQRATVDLVPGSLLAPGQYGNAPRLTPGLVAVGAILKPGQYPLALERGAAVQVVTLPVADDAPSTTSPPVQAIVVDLADPSDSGQRSATLGVPAADAPRIATAGAAGRVALVVLPK